MADLAGLASIINAADQRLRQTEAVIARLQQNRAAIGAGLLLIELSHHRAAA
jgi:hypothetical protein